MIEILLAMFLFATVFVVGLAIDNARSVARQVQPAWTLLFRSKNITGARSELSSIKQSVSRRKARKERVLIFGAGESGIRLAERLATQRDLVLIGFADDNLELRNDSIAGLKVFTGRALPDLVRRQRVSRIVLALPTAAARRRSEIIAQLGDLPVHVQTLPNKTELDAGSLQIDDLQELTIADILGRDERDRGAELRRDTIEGSSVLVTGAGGSIGSELCAQIVRYGASRLVLYDISEFALYAVHREILELVSKGSVNVEIVPLLGSVKDQGRLEEALEAYRIDTVYHAAAYKHVPLVEHNMIEGVANNILGTLFAAEAAINVGVKNFILVSTDKAVNPTSVVGASKRVAEQILQSLNARSVETRFLVVRFGNVLEASGSVVPMFHEQIRRGGPVTVTHKDIVRYFMTVTEAASLVIQSVALAKGGEVFVLDMGRPVRIAELAEKMIQFSGLSVLDNENPDGDIEIQYVGLRPAEKLYEELLVDSHLRGTAHPKIMIADEEYPSWEILEPLLADLSEACRHLDRDKIRNFLVQTVPEYSPSAAVEDLVWRQLDDQERLEEQGSDRIYSKAVGEPARLADIISIEAFRKGR